MPTAEDVLAQQTKDWQNAPRRVTWQPPEDGDYLGQITDVRTELANDGDAIIQVIAEIVDGQYLGKKTVAGFFKGIKMFGMLADLTDLLGGPANLPSAMEAVKFLQSKVGSFVQLTRTTNKKTKKAFVNITSIIVPETAEPAAS
jgi:hypothetical protein